jgi:hypothetical protein
MLIFNLVLVVRSFVRIVDGCCLATHVVLDCFCVCCLFLCIFVSMHTYFTMNKL